SVFLVVIAALFARALQQAGATHPGFDPHGVELSSIDLGAAGYTNETAPLVAREVLDRVRALPSVQSATIAAVLPGGLERFGLSALRVPGSSQLLSGDWNIVEPGYCATMKMQLVAGRVFVQGDRLAGEPVAIVGEGVVRRFWADRRPADVVGESIVQQRF